MIYSKFCHMRNLQFKSIWFLEIFYMEKLMTQTRIKQTKNTFNFIYFLLNYKYPTTTSELLKKKLRLSTKNTYFGIWKTTTNPRNTCSKSTGIFWGDYFSWRKVSYGNNHRQIRLLPERWTADCMKAETLIINRPLWWKYDTFIEISDLIYWNAPLIFNFQDWIHRQEKYCQT